MIRVKLLRPLKVDGIERAAGDELAVDGELADLLLRSADVVPARESDARAWRASLQPAARNWVRDWKR